MTNVLEFLMHLITHYGYVATVVFVICSSVPLLAVVYLMFSGTMVGKAIDKKFSEKLEKEKEAHIEGNKFRKKFTKEVHEILEEVAYETDADRALVFEFSNGTSNLVGLPFLFMSAAAEVVMPNVQPVSALYQKVNISIAAKFLLSLEEHGYIYIEDLQKDKDAYPILAYLMLPNNAKSALFYSLQGVDETIGFIVITTVTSSNKILDKYESIPVVARAAQKVSTLINFNELTKRSEESKKKKNKRK